MELSGSIFDIQRFSLHDGPGIRTTVFLKGCSLRCFWCHNPEGISFKKQIQFTESRCIQCGTCVIHCPEGAQLLIDGQREFARELCQLCGECVQFCYADALVQVGRTVTVSEVMKEVIADQPFYATSGGGVTLSGGEPALQPDFATALLESCRKAGIHTAIETSANVSWTILRKLIGLSDLVMMDLKHLDEQKHQMYTGASNRRILENAKRVVQMNKPVIFRTPVIPTVNDNQEVILEIAEFIFDLQEYAKLSSNGFVDITWELLPFHKLAADKYKNLGLEYLAKDLNVLSKEKITELQKVLSAAGVPAKITG